MGIAAERIWLITGASRGLGLTLARRVLARGDRVIVAARKPGAFSALLAEPDIDGSRVLPLELDVTDTPENLCGAMERAVARWGRVDVLVNNAGIGDVAPSEEADPGYAMLMAKTNYFGVVNVTNALLPHFRARRAGKVIVIGSRMAYRTAFPGAALYSATKAAVHAYAECLSAEVKQFGISVMIVILGAFESGLDINLNPGKQIPDYDATRAQITQGIQMRSRTQNSGDPAKAMGVVVDVVRGEERAAGRNGMPLWLVLGDDALANVREKLGKMASVINEWEAVGMRLGKLD